MALFNWGEVAVPPRSAVVASSSVHRVLKRFELRRIAHDPHDDHLREFRELVRDEMTQEIATTPPRGARRRPI